MLTTVQTDLSNIPESHLSDINHLLSNSKSDNTKRAYESDWKVFTNFCLQYNHTPLAASEETLVHFISEMSKTHAYHTIKRYISSISKAHKTSRHVSPIHFPLVIEIMEGLKRTKGNISNPKKALLLEDICSLVDVINTKTIHGKRDKALILLGFSLASRRSELTSLNIEDVSISHKGMDVNVYESKTQSHNVKTILYSNNAYCPIEALKAWLNASSIQSGALFRSINNRNHVLERLTDQSVATIIKKYTDLVGLDPKLYAGHSLRSGFATSAAEHGISESKIMHQTGHKTRGMLDRYIQSGNKYKNNATSILATL